MRILVSFLILICFAFPMFGQAQTQQEMQNEMKQMVAEAKSEIADKEKEIAEAKKDKLDTEIIQGLEEELFQLKKELSVIEGMFKGVSPISGVKADSINVADNDLSGRIFPERKTSLINALPKRVLSQSELTGFLSKLNNDLKLKLPTDKVKTTQEVIAKLGDNNLYIANSGVAAWYNNAPSEAVLLLTYAASKSPDDNTLNNCGAILNLSKMEEKAIPVLKFALSHQPDNSTLLNNVGQAFAGLGERDSAMVYFKACMLQSPSHPEAFGTAALIESERGNTEQALEYIRSAMKNGYTKDREEFYNSKKTEGTSQRLITLEEVDDKIKYFEIGGFKIAPNCRNWEDCESVTAGQQEFYKRIDDLKTRFEGIIASYDRPVYQNSNRGIFADAAQLKISEIYDDYLDRRTASTQETRVRYMNAGLDEAKELETSFAKFEAQFDACRGQGRGCREKIELEKCKEMTSIQNKHFNAIADIADDYKAEWYEKDIKVYNIMLFYFSLRAINDSALKAECAAQALGLLTNFSSYIWSNSCNPASKPDCNQYDSAKNTTNGSPDFKDAKCPIDIKASFGIGKINLTCDKFKIEGGEGIIGSYEKDFITKESTLAVGAGAGIYVPGAEISASENLFIKFDSNNQPSDAGFGFEASGKILGTTIAKGGYTLGVNSGYTFK